jgi:hypothetical protein
VLSAELGGLPLELTFRDAVVAASATGDRTGRVELGPFRVAEAADDTVSLTAFPLRSSDPQAFAEAALQLAIPALRAIWFESESADRLDGLTAAAAIEVAGRADPESVSRPVLVGQLGWRDGEGHVVVFLATSDDHPSRTLGNVVRLLWRRAMGRGALTEANGGWIAVLEAEDDDALAATVDRIRTELAPSLTELGIGAGLSSVDASPARLPDLVTEARLAARCAWGAADAGVASFSDLRLSAVGFLFDPADARTIARLVLPEFCAAPDLPLLVASVAAFLDHGSVSAAAHALTVHRNTLTARLDRARTLGLPVGDPRFAFPVTAVVRALNEGHSA